MHAQSPVNGLLMGALSKQWLFRGSKHKNKKVKTNQLKAKSAISLIKVVWSFPGHYTLCPGGEERCSTPGGSNGLGLNPALPRTLHGPWRGAGLCVWTSGGSCGLGLNPALPRTFRRFCRGAGLCSFLSVKMTAPPHGCCARPVKDLCVKCIPKAWRQVEDRSHHCYSPLHPEVFLQLTRGQQP